MTIIRSSWMQYVSISGSSSCALTFVVVIVDDAVAAAVTNVVGVLVVSVALSTFNLPALLYLRMLCLCFCYIWQSRYKTAPERYIGRHVLISKRVADCISCVSLAASLRGGSLCIYYLFHVTFV